MDRINHRFYGGQVPYWAPMPLNDIAYANALDVLKTPVREEGKKYSRGLTAPIDRQFVCIETPLLNKLYKCAEVHRTYFYIGLYFSEMQISPRRKPILLCNINSSK